MDVCAENHGRPCQKLRFPVALVVGRNFVTPGCADQTIYVYVVFSSPVDPPFEPPADTPFDSTSQKLFLSSFRRL